jgi:hypothetical protein
VSGTHADVGARDRLRWLRRTAKRWFLAIALLVVALLVGANWSYGLFSDSTTNPRNVVSAGSMSQTNTADNAAIMGATSLVPGDVIVGTATIVNEGGARGDFTLNVTDVKDEPGAGGGQLSTRLTVKVFDLDLAAPVYNGPLVGLDVSLGTWEVNEERSYRVEVRFPGQPGSADNPFQRSKVTATFEWNAIQAH